MSDEQFPAKFFPAQFFLAFPLSLWTAAAVLTVLVALADDDANVRIPVMILVGSLVSPASKPSPADAMSCGNHVIGVWGAYCCFSFILALLLAVLLYLAFGRKRDG